MDGGQIAGASSLIVAIKNAIDLLSKVKEAAKAIDQAELKLMIAELTDQLADAKMGAARLKDEMLELQQENARLKAKAVEEKPIVKDGCYQFPGDDTLYCPRCYEKEGLKMPTSWFMRPFCRQCPSCKAQIGSSR